MNKVIEYENYIALVTTDGQEILIDRDDYNLVKQPTWRANARGYAIAKIGEKTYRMHRIIMKSKPHTDVDHINHNKLDNRRSNLRVCNHHENNGNREKAAGCYTSQYKGVSWDKWRNNWRADIKFDHKHHFLGRFDNEVDATIAYNKAAPLYFGEFACLNTI